MPNDNDETDEVEWEVSYDVPDRSTVKPEDVDSGMPSGHMHCDECETTMLTTPGRTSVECECGHRWTLNFLPADMMDNL